RPKLACSRCDVIVQAPLPPKPIERGYASAGLLHGSWSANIWNISLYIASQKYTRDRAWS
ncbi:ISSfl4 ORF3, partial [Shigella flexneri 2a str. 2457T]